jgi:hypothetical protein
VDADLDTLATALYVRVDDLLICHPERVPWRPRVGIAPKITDAELVTLAVMAVLLGFTSETRWLRFARAHPRHLFRYLPEQPGYNKRLRKLAATIGWLIGALARDTTLWSDDVWVADSTPIECGRSRETAKRSDLAGFAEYGYCASHSRYFWGLRLHLLCTLHGLPVGFALTGAKADDTLLHIIDGVLTGDPDLSGRAGQTLIADKNYYGRDFEATLPQLGISLLRPAPARANPTDPAPATSNRYARPSNRSTTPSKANSTSNTTAPAPWPASWSASGNASSPSPPSSGTTTPSPHRSNDHSSPTTTNTPWNHPSRARLQPGGQFQPLLTLASNSIR